jgi:hypothetical protein
MTDKVRRSGEEPQSTRAACVQGSKEWEGGQVYVIVSSECLEVTKARRKSDWGCESDGNDGKGRRRCESLSQDKSMHTRVSLHMGIVKVISYHDKYSNTIT